MNRRRSFYWLRRSTQLASVAFLGYLVLMSLLHGEDAGSASAEAFCAFGGLEGLYRFASSGGQTLAKTHLSNLVILAATVLTTLFARGFFCGWLCPLGTIQEWLGALAGRIFRRRWAPPERVDAWLRRIRFVTLAAIIAATITAGRMVFQAYDPFAALLKMTELGLGAGGLILAGILIASLFIDRPWCRYLCPLGGFLGLVGRLSLYKVVRRSLACVDCGLCSRNCPMGIRLHNGQASQSTSCIGCLECVAACPVPEALDVSTVAGRSSKEGAVVNGD